MELYVSTTGRDAWSGRLPEPNEDGTDGPFATLDRARREARELRTSARLTAPLTVRLRDGVYRLSQPLAFGVDDSAPVTYAAYPGETPILDGGELLGGWRTETVAGRPAWVTDLPDVAAGRWSFRELYVNGERRSRARWPKEGYCWIESAPRTPLTAGLFDGDDQFVAAPGDLAALGRVDDVDVVLLHYWIEEHLPLATYDPETRLATTRYPSTFSLKDDFKPRYARYYVENARETLSEPGEWYLDRQAGTLTYLPLDSETMDTTEVVAPRVTQLVRIVGEPDRERFAEHLRFVGLTFQHTDHQLPSEGGDIHAHPDRRWINAPQGAANIPGAIYLEGARYCAFEDCVIRNVGQYGIQLADGCFSNRVVGCELHDLGAGGVHLNGSDAAGPRSRRTGLNRITDNHLHHGGRIFHSAVGILSRHSFGNQFSHNHIHDFFYSGISCGWVWGYAENVSRDNRIEHNHIHSLGHGVLSDMGGIYTLGVQPGTVLRGNLIHDVRRHNYGGWAIYPDEGSSHLVIENNICYGTDSQVFHQHYGRENTIRNNIFAFGEEALAAQSRATPDAKALTFECNLWLTSGSPVFTLGRSARLSDRNHRSESNLYWDVTGASPKFRGMTADGEQDLDLAGWQALGHDLHGVVADPKFADPEHGDFTLADDSPALALGFEPIDLSHVGPRPAAERE